MIFQIHIEKLCSKANRKLHALLRIAPYVDMQKENLQKLFLIRSLAIDRFFRYVAAVHLITK